MTFRKFMHRLWCATVACVIVCGCAAAPQQGKAAPAPDWPTATDGGRGGALLRVTTLAGDGPGSLRAAIETAGPRIVVFEVGGVIDLARNSLNVRHPHLTIAGQTAPSPGITLIRGGLNIGSHDIIVQHIRVRVGADGAARGSGWEADAIATRAAHDVIVDHCSLTWATDENLSASGPRAEGADLAQWRANTSHRITFSHNIIAEGLADSSHAKFEHSKGSLIHDNVTGLLLYANLYAHNYERSPMFKGGVSASMINNVIYDPGQRAIHYNLMVNEWRDQPFVTGHLDIIGNVLRAGPSTEQPIALFMLGGHGDVNLYMRDNLAVDRIGQPLPLLGRYSTDRAQMHMRDEPVYPQSAPGVRPANEVERYVLTEAGARPWDRDWHDVRVLANAAEGRGEIIDDESEVGGYPQATPVRRPFVPEQWDLATLWPHDMALLDNAAGSKGT